MNATTNALAARVAPLGLRGGSLGGVGAPLAPVEVAVAVAVVESRMGHARTSFLRATVTTAGDGGSAFALNGDDGVDVLACAKLAVSARGGE